MRISNDALLALGLLEKAYHIPYADRPAFFAEHCAGRPYALSYIETRYKGREAAANFAAALAKVLAAAKPQSLPAVRAAVIAVASDQGISSLKLSRALARAVAASAYRTWRNGDIATQQRVWAIAQQKIEPDLDLTFTSTVALGSLRISCEEKMIRAAYASFH